MCKAHVEYLQRIVRTIQNGGSALLAGEFGSDAIEASSQYPERLFENLDKDWQQFARESDAGEIGFEVPPVLSIILTRCGKRDAIPTVIKNLRAEARAKVWALLNRLRTVGTIGERRDIGRAAVERRRRSSRAAGW